MAARLPLLIYRKLNTSNALRSAHDVFSHGDPEKIKQASEFWRKTFYYVCVPAMILCSVNCVLHNEHVRPEFKPYEHLRIRNKAFPWKDGNKTLFHNPHLNALPNGYEDEH